MKAITIRQPWAWLIFHGKDIENRDWPSHFRGPLAIHAAKGMTRGEYEDAVEFVCNFDTALAARIPEMLMLKRGAIIGTVQMVACVEDSDSPWFMGKYGHIYQNPKLLEKPVLISGALGLWEWGTSSEQGGGTHG